MLPYILTIVVLVGILVAAVAYAFWPSRHGDED